MRCVWGGTMHLRQLRLANWCMCICTLVLMSYKVNSPGMERWVACQYWHKFVL